MDRELATMISCIVAFLIVVLSIAAGISWYAAGVQQRVWARQGVEMTQWEVFCGADPIVRNMIEEKQQ